MAVKTTQKTNAVIDFDTFLSIKTNNAKDRKSEKSDLILENHLGKMIEERFELELFLIKKKINFNELLTSLNKK